jgi:hypothetical protein
MRYVLVAVGLMLAVPSAAVAMQSQSHRNELCQIMQPCMPPPAYASGPFLAEPVIVNVSMRQIQKICGGGARAFLGDHVNAAGSSYSIFGCAKLEGTKCIVHVPSDVRAISADLYDVILEHELGHCRGWRHRAY